MGYNVSFKVKIEGIDKYIDVGNCNANITYNVREIITRSTGLEWRNCENNGLCIEVIPRIREGLHKLNLNRESYIPYENLNGWAVSDTMKFFMQILDAWEYLELREPEIAKIATFWIE